MRRWEFASGCAGMPEGSGLNHRPIYCPLGAVRQVHPFILQVLSTLLLPILVNAGSFPRGSHILYSRVGNPDGSIGILSVDTRTDLTVMKGEWPILAPREPRLLYHIGNPNFAHANIRYRNLATGADRQLLAGTDFIVGVDWSFDMQNVIFDYGCGVEIVRVDGSGRRGFLGGDCYDDAPAVNPFDGRIVFHNANAGLFLADADGQRRRFMAGTRRGDVWPVWSPAADQVAFWAGTSLVVQNIDGSDRTDLSAKAQVVTTQGDGRPAWTPDGDWVVAGTTLNGTNGLFAFAVDGSATVVPLPTSPGNAISWVGGVLTARQIADWIDVSASATMDPPSVPAGDPATLTVTIVNRGPGVVRGLRVTNQVPDGVRLLAAEVSRGTIEQNGSTVVAVLGELAAGGSISVALDLISAVAGPHFIQSTATSTNAGSETVIGSVSGKLFIGKPQALYNEGVIYGRQDGSGTGVWYSPADGSAEVKITDGGRPRLSPDGTGLAFVRGNVAGSRANLWWRDLGTGEETLLFNVNDYLVGLTWSLDSQWVIFDYSCAIYARTRAGTDPGLTIGGSCYFDGPSVQPVDGRVAFHSNDGMYTANAAYQDTRKIPNTRAGDYWPVWSPDGRWMVFVSGGDLWKIQPDGGGRVQLTRNAVKGEGFSDPAAWTVTGRLVIAAGKYEGRTGLFKVVPSGVDAPVLFRALPDDSKVTDVGAAVGTLLEGIQLRARLESAPNAGSAKVAISGPAVAYVIEGTTDLVHWSRVYTNLPPASVPYRVEVNRFPYRYFRGLPVAP